MKLKDITSVCMNARNPIRIIIKGTNEELDLITAIRKQEKEIFSFDFEIVDCEIVCFIRFDSLK